VLVCHAPTDADGRREDDTADAEGERAVAHLETGPSAQARSIGGQFTGNWADHSVDQAFISA
jgi:hypothetical protein